MKAIFSVLTAVGLMLATPHAGAQAFQRAEEDRVLAMVNHTRAEHGLAPLVRHGGLVDVARRQSVRMLEQKHLHHNPALRSDLDALGLAWRWSGENVGVGPSVDSIEDAFVASPSHYENIVRPNYTALGVGVIGPTETGYVYVTQVFAELETAATATPTIEEPAPARPSPRQSPPAPPIPRPAATLTQTPSHLPDHVVIEGGVTNDSPVPAPA